MDAARSRDIAKGSQVDSDCYVALDRSRCLGLTGPIAETTRTHRLNLHRQAINDPQSVARGHVPAAWRVPSHQGRLADIPPQNRSDYTVSGEALTPAPFPSEVPTPGRWIRSDRGTGRWLRPRKILDWSTLATQRGGWAIQPLIHTGQHNGWYTRGIARIAGVSPVPHP